MARRNCAWWQRMDGMTPRVGSLSGALSDLLTLDLIYSPPVPGISSPDSAAPPQVISGLSAQGHRALRHAFHVPSIAAYRPCTEGGPWEVQDLGPQAEGTGAG